MEREGDAFGTSSPSIATIDMPLRMAGQYHDKETNLFYNYFRFYDPKTGRYVTSDPIGLEGGTNTYGYVGANPTALTDPRGLSPAAGMGCAAGAWAGPVGCGVGGMIGLAVNTIGIFAISQLMDDVDISSEVDENTCDKKDCEQTYYHYTNYQNFQSIVSSGFTIHSNSRGFVYLTKFAYSPSVAQQALFMGARSYQGKGDYVIKMKIKCDTPLVGGTQPNELIHYGTLRLGRQITQIIYAGPNIVE